ncbi:MAG: Gfo/Idh/MocA family protein [Armatimonadota bacterium]
MDKLKVGVIGCGVIGSRNLMDAQACELIEVVAAADLRVERREWAAQQGVPRVYEDGRDLLDNDEEVEAVIIAFPAGTRTAMVLRAFARGKHALIEKPIARNAREVQTMIQRRGQLTAGCFSGRYRACDSAEVATRFVASGALGELRELHLRAFIAAGPPTGNVPPPWRESFAMNAGGILTNWSCYDLDYLLGIAGWSFVPRVALAQFWPCAEQFRHFVAPESDADAHYAGFVLGEGGTILTVERGEFAATASRSAWEIIGSKGALRLTMLASGERQIIHDDGSSSAEGTVTRTLWEGDDRAGSGNPRLIEDFARAALEGRQPITSLENSLVIARITDAIYASALSGAAVEIPAD